MDNKELRVCVIGLGYVGLPLAVSSSKKYETVGFDLNGARVDELKRGKDNTLEVNESELASAKKLLFTDNVDDIVASNFYIITVPTPIDSENNPNLSHLLAACTTVSKSIKRGDIIVIESTVAPGTTEDICAKFLERESGLAFNKDFFVGFSPERINPGDKKKRIGDIVKVTSGSTKEAARNIDNFYNSIIPAGTHLTSSIKVAEAAKIIENVQRDINIALMNEFSQINDLLGISTKEVLEAARTKWNFMAFSPGLVGGHCIGVDPYYLVSCAEQLGFDSQLITTGRQTNENVPKVIADKIETLHGKTRASIGYLGLTFKENCPDLRNSKALELAKLLHQRHEVSVFDPYISDSTVSGLGLQPSKGLNFENLDFLIVAVPHKYFSDLSLKIYLDGIKTGGYLIDVKSIWSAEAAGERINYWAL